MSSLPRPAVWCQIAPPMGLSGRWESTTIPANQVRLGHVVQIDGGPVWGRVLRRRHVGGRVVLEMVCALVAARLVQTNQPGELLQVYRCQNDPNSQPPKNDPILPITL